MLARLVLLEEEEPCSLCLGLLGFRGRRVVAKVVRLWLRAFGHLCGLDFCARVSTGNKTIQS